MSCQGHAGSFKRDFPVSLGEKGVICYVLYGAEDVECIVL